MILKKSYLHPLLNGLIILLVLWLVGLVLFARGVMLVREGDLDHIIDADGIVVLTGGSERVDAGLSLLQASRAPRLLISGLGADDETDMQNITDKIIPPNHPARRYLNCCITLGTYAENTHGNAIETAAWARKFGLKSLIIVTANYHMPRAMMEMMAAMPQSISNTSQGITLIPYAINPDHVRLNNWWLYSGTATLLMDEYHKIFFAAFKIMLNRTFKPAPISAPDQPSTPS